MNEVRKPALTEGMPDLSSNTDMYYVASYFVQYVLLLRSGIPSVNAGFLTSFIIAPNIMKPQTKARTSSLSTDEK